MNIKNLRTIIRAIENHQEFYNQINWGWIEMCGRGLVDEECSNPSCLGGWCRALFPKIKGPHTERLAAVLDIDYQHAEALTFASWPRKWFVQANVVVPIHLDHKRQAVPNSYQAVSILKAMADSGDIWDYSYMANNC